MEPEAYDLSYFESLVQATFVGRIPIEAAQQQFWVNLIGEYTWKEGIANYIRFEQGFEWKVLNIALRQMFYINSGQTQDLFLLESSVEVLFLNSSRPVFSKHVSFGPPVT